MSNSSQKLNKITQIIQKASKNKKHLKDLLTDILSRAEIDDISDRIDIFRELLQDKTQREVSSSLKVSIAKVTRASHVLKYGTRVLHKLF